MPKTKQIKMKNVSGESLYVNAGQDVFRFSPGEELIIPAESQKFFNTQYFKEVSGAKE